MRYSSIYFKVRYTLCVIIWLLLCFSLPGHAQSINQEKGRFLIQNYTAETYAAFPQNFNAIQTHDGRLVVANVDGFLTYNGTTWSLLKSGHAIKMINIGSDGKIYAGLGSDFGYLLTDDTGNLMFESLLPYSEYDANSIGSVWEVYDYQGDIFFRHDKGVLKWDGKKITEYKAEKKFLNSFRVYDRYIVLDTQKGLLELSGDSFKALPGSEKTAKIKVIALLPHDSGKILMVTANDGLFLYSEETGLQGVEIEGQEALTKSRLYSAIQLANGKYLFGSIYSGIFLYSSQFNLERIITTETGLIDNTVLGLYEEENGAVWATTYNGISRISLNNEIYFWSEENGLAGVLHDIDRFKNELYIATNQGIFKLDQSEDKAISPIQPVNIPIAQTWQILNADSELLIASSDGLFIYNGKRYNQLDKMTTFSLIENPNFHKTYFAGRKQGLFSIDLNNKIKLTPISGIDDEIRSMAWDKKGNLWLGMINSGTKQIQFSEDGEVSDIIYYGKEDGLPDHWLDVDNIDDRVVFLSEDGIYEFNYETKQFSKTKLLALPSTSHRAGMVLQINDSTLWLSDDKMNTYAYKKTQNGNYQQTPSNIDYLPNLTMYARHIDSDGTVWVGNAKLLYLVNPEHKTYFNPKLKPIFSSITKSDTSHVYAGWFFNSTSSIPFTQKNPLRLPSLFRRVNISYTMPDFESGKALLYQYRLKGFEDNWSRWTSETRNEYTNLNKGNYVFEVRAKNASGQISSGTSLSIVVEPGLFNSWYSYLLYTLFAVGIIYATALRVQKYEKEKADKELMRQNEKAKLVQSKLEKEAAELRAQAAELQAKMIEEESRRKTEELEQAREVQQHFLPNRNPEIKFLDLFTYQISATEVGGDYYDYFLYNENEVTLVVGDATGHGVGSGLMVASTKASLLTMVCSGVKPTANLLNTTLKQITLSRRLNMALMMAHLTYLPEKKVVQVSLTGGGIPPVYILRNKGSVEEIVIEGMPFGVGLISEYLETTIELSNQDTMIMVTDGLPERTNDKEEQLGYERLNQSLIQYGTIYGKMLPEAKAKAKATTNLLSKLAEKWANGVPQDDDITILTAKVIIP